MAAPKDLVRPTKIAHELGIKSQLIYGWLKSGKLDAYTVGNFTNAVSANAVRTLANNSAKKGPRREGTRTRKVKDSTGNWQDKGFPPPLDKGEVVSYGSKEGKKVGQVQQTDEYFTQLRFIAAQEADREREFQNTSLTDLLKQKKIKIEPLEDLVNFVLFSIGDERSDTEVREFLAWMRKWDYPIIGPLNDKLVEWLDSHEPEILEDSSCEITGGEIEDAPYIEDEKRIMESPKFKNHKGVPSLSAVLLADTLEDELYKKLDPFLTG
jgi:hypothetical protein